MYCCSALLSLSLMVCLLFFATSFAFCCAQSTRSLSWSASKVVQERFLPHSWLLPKLASHYWILQLLGLLHSQWCRGCSTLSLEHVPIQVSWSLRFGFVLYIFQAELLNTELSTGVRCILQSQLVSLYDICYSVKNMKVIADGEIGVTGPKLCLIGTYTNSLYP